MEMEMEKARAMQVQKDLIRQLEDVQKTAGKMLQQLSAAQVEGKLVPTNGSVYGLLGLTVMNMVKDESEYNTLIKQITRAEHLQGR